MLCATNALVHFFTLKIVEWKQYIEYTFTESWNNDREIINKSNNYSIDLKK